MNTVILSPPVAFLIYLVLVGLLSGMGRRFARPGRDSENKRSTYASGEAPPERPAAPGYRPFFVVALFFAILHLGALMVGSSNLTLTSSAYLVGLGLALLALILG